VENRIFKRVFNEPIGFKLVLVAQRILSNWQRIALRLVRAGQQGFYATPLPLFPQRGQREEVLLKKSYSVLVQSEQIEKLV